jgi:Spy/CpxP family protein refolding chaperone
MRVVSTMLALAVSLVIVGNLLAADEKEGKHARRQPTGQGDLFPAAMLKSLNLTDDQKAKVKEVMSEYGPKLKEARESILTADQKKARDDAAKAAKDAGKKPAEVFRAAMTAVTLTDDQKAKMKETVAPLRKEAIEKVTALLTPEQQEQLQKARKERRGHGAEGK